ncbi:MAG TPA: hypothetical protein VKU02_09590, partial [Gemmataceae bacterium]|nr:hypothetical protein [Gemmataceae bacterium]
TFGPMNLTQRGDQVRGVCSYMNIECAIEGKATGGKLVFTYREPTITGEGWFELTRYGKGFAGEFRPDGEQDWESWEGERIGFDGLWNSSFGLLRLVEEEDRVHGFYEVEGQATIIGRRTANRLAFNYRESRSRGRGCFELAADGLSFQGEWKVRGGKGWRPWSGIRVRPQRNLVWLVVLEAPWQRRLSEQEYSFGHMLREFFARVAEVQVRHRFFVNEAGLRKCCRDLMYLAEPVVLVLATHAKTEGIVVDGETIGLHSLLKSLRHAGDLRLLHFSACLLLQDPKCVTLLRDYGKAACLPISGYTTSVDWAESAIIEFTYLDMILARGMAPAVAAEQVLKLLLFAGNNVVADSVYPPAGFTVLLPGDGETERRTAKKGASTKALR